MCFSNHLRNENEVLEHLTFHGSFVIRSIRAMQAAVNCIKRVLDSCQHKVSRPTITLVSDTPSLIMEIAPKLTEFAEVKEFSLVSI